MHTTFRMHCMAALAAVLLLASCSKSNKPGKMVPKDAGIVLHIDSRSLAGKADMAEIRQSAWYQEIRTKMESDTTVPEFIRNLSDNIGHSGIDSLGDFVFFGENKTGEGMKLVLEGSLNDAGAFENFIKKIYTEGNIRKEGEMSTMPVKDKAVLTWNKEKFAIGMQSPSATESLLPGIAPGGGTDKPPVDLQQLATYCKNLYTLKDDENLSKNEKFTGLINTEGDVHLWMNAEKLASGSLQMGVLSMMKFDKLLEGNISTLTLNFDKGMVSVRSKGYAGKELSELYSKYSGGSINTDMIKNIPSQDLVGVMALHFKPEGLRELVKLTGMDGFLDILISRLGFTLDDFVKANKSDVVFAVTDLTVKPDSVSFTGADGSLKTIHSQKSDAHFIFSAAIDNKEAFNKLINAAKTASGGSSDNKISYNSNGKFFAIGNSADMVNKTLAGGGKNESPLLSRISGNAIGGFVDLQKIMKAFSSDIGKDSIDKIRWDESVKLWDNIIFTGGDYSGGGYNQAFEINLMDKNTNSLKQLVRYSIILSDLEKEKKKKLDADFNLSDLKMEEVKPDITTAPPPPPPARPGPKKK